MGNKPGRLGTFSQGKCSKDDEGDIAISIHHTKSVVIIDFGTPVTWIGLSPEAAEKMAEVLLSHADQIRRGAH